MLACCPIRRNLHFTLDEPGRTAGAALPSPLQVRLAKKHIKCFQPNHAPALLVYMVLLVFYHQRSSQWRTAPLKLMLTGPSHQARLLQAQPFQTLMWQRAPLPCRIRRLHPPPRSKGSPAGSASLDAQLTSCVMPAHLCGTSFTGYCASKSAVAAAGQVCKLHCTPDLQASSTSNSNNRGSSSSSSTAPSPR